MLKRHPGDNMARWTFDFDRVPAASMIHYFRAERPGQNRGIPEITPALPLFAQLRRYTLAVMAAAETAADFAAVLYTDAPANGEAADVEPMDLVELERRMATVLPGGWRLGQIQAEQPSTTYAEFKKEILNEIARCLNMPFNVAAGNSSGYNYASGRLDHQTYYKSIRVDQAQLGLVVLDRVLRAWLDEAILISDFLPRWMRTAAFRDLKHQWFWDGQEHVDPAKEANAQATRLKSYTTTPGLRIRPAGPRLGERTPPAGQGSIPLMEQLGLPLAQPQAGCRPLRPTNTTEEQDNAAETAQISMRPESYANPAGSSSRPLATERPRVQDRPRLPRFSMVAYTGGPMRMAGWRYPVIVDLAGLAIPSQNRPIRFGHDMRPAASAIRTRSDRRRKTSGGRRRLPRHGRREGDRRLGPQRFSVAGVDRRQRRGVRVRQRGPACDWSTAGSSGAR